MADPLTRVNLGNTPQTKPIPGREAEMVQNNAGGFSFKLDSWSQLERFLILGTWGGTYYVREDDLTIDNATNLVKLLKTDGRRVVDTIVDVSVNGRAYKQNPTIYALAVACSSEDRETRSYALSKVSEVCRTGTMLFNLMKYLTMTDGHGNKVLRGGGRGRNEALGHWYTRRPVDNLALQTIKYRQRDGWSHRDILRLARPYTPLQNPIDVPTDADASVIETAAAVNARIAEANMRRDIMGWVVGKNSDPQHPLIQAFIAAQATKDEAEWIRLITEAKLPWEALPTQALNSPKVWEALVPHLGLTAIMRNLGKMSAAGALVPSSNVAKAVVARINDNEALRRQRVHPMQVLLASSTYAAGRGVRGSNTWTVVPSVVDALTDSFYATFGNLEVTNKRRLIALDVSGSMQQPIMNTHLFCSHATAALAMVALQQDPDTLVMAFDTSFKQLAFSKSTRLNDAIRMAQTWGGGGTNCALPMEWATKTKGQFDSFEVYTDNETWSGRNGHPAQALRAYRQASGIDAKLVINGMTATGISIADPKDPGMLDVVGFDANTPKVVTDFIK